MRKDWDERFMRLVCGEPLSWSHIPGKEGGAAALLVSPDRRRFSIGYAGLPHDCSSVLESQAYVDDDVRDRLCRHAERNAVSNAGCDLTGWTAYVTAEPCLECAIELHAHRISRVVCRPLREGSRWRESCDRGRNFLQLQRVAYTCLG